MKFADELLADFRSGEGQSSDVFERHLPGHMLSPCRPKSAWLNTFMEQPSASVLREAGSLGWRWASLWLYPFVSGMM